METELKVAAISKVTVALEIAVVSTFKFWAVAIDIIVVMKGVDPPLGVMAVFKVLAMKLAAWDPEEIV